MPNRFIFVAFLFFGSCLAYAQGPLRPARGAKPAVSVVAKPAGKSPGIITTIRVYVSPNGNDEAVGSEEEPLLSVFEARKRVRKFLRTEGDEPIEVILLPGRYQLDSTLVLGPEDCDADRKVTWDCPLGKKAILSGGVQILGWEPMRGGIWKAQCKLPSFRQLYVNGERRLKARGVTPQDLQPWSENNDSLVGYRTRMLPLTHSQVGKLEMVYNTANGTSVMPVRNISMDSTGEKRIEMDPIWWKMMHRKEGPAIGLPAFMEGAMPLLDQPGEWYHDQKEGMLYYYPLPSEELTQDEVIVPRLASLLRIEGRPDANVTNLKISGLAFMDGRYELPQNKPFLNVLANMLVDTARMEQIDSLYLGPRYGEYESCAAHVTLTYCEDVTLFGCRFSRLGSTGLKLGLGCEKVLVEYCLFDDISGNGIQVGEVGRAGHHPNTAADILIGNTIKNCLIRRVACEFEGGVGILLAYTQNTTIESNELTQLPYAGLQMGWGWGRPDSGGMPGQRRIFENPTVNKNAIVRGNHIHKVMLRFSEGGAIQTMGEQAGGHIEENMLYSNPNGHDVYVGPGTAHLSILRNKTNDASKPNITVKKDVRSSARAATLVCDVTGG